MNDQHDETAPLYAESPPPPPPPPVVEARRTLGLPVVGAIAAATLLIGGLAGGIIGYAVHSDGPDFGQGPGQFRQGGPGGPFPGQPGQQDQQGQPQGQPQNQQDGSDS